MRTKIPLYKAFKFTVYLTTSLKIVLSSSHFILKEVERMAYGLGFLVANSRMHSARLRRKELTEGH